MSRRKIKCFPTHPKARTRTQLAALIIKADLLRCWTKGGTDIPHAMLFRANIQLSNGNVVLPYLCG